jgi:hypothetical protein
MSLYVFVGPSISASAVKTMTDAICLPPVAMGDVIRLMARKPTAIGIIDGVFETVPAVWHKEILFALSQGVPVYGSSSMGALRAAELHTFGMRGVGTIFEQFRDGVLEDDDEVAVAHATAEHDFQPLSDPMVNIRAAIARALEAGIISPSNAEALIAHAKAQFYPERSWPRLLRSGGGLGVPEGEITALAQMFPTPPNIKRDDAIALLEIMQRDAAEGRTRQEANFDFEPTYYWNGLVAFESAASTPRAEQPEALSLSALGRHVRLTHAERQQLLRDALFSFLLYHEAKRCGLLPSDDNGSHAALTETSRVLPLNNAEFGGVLNSIEKELIQVLRSRLDLFIAAELEKRGELASTVQEIQRKLKTMRANGVMQPRLSSASIDINELSAWYEARFGKPSTTGDAHARELGFVSWEEFISEALAEYLHDVDRKTWRPQASAATPSAR